MKRLNQICLAVIVILIIGINVLRFINLEQSPPGFHVDEVAGSTTMQCLAQEGKDALGEPYPLFSDLKFGTPKPPTYIYPGMIWAKLFGTSIASFRGLSAFAAVLCLVGLFFLVQQFFGSTCALLAVLNS